MINALNDGHSRETNLFQDSVDVWMWQCSVIGAVGVESSFISTPNDLLQCRGQVRVLVLVTGLQGPLGGDSLALGENHSPLGAQQSVQNESGDGEDGGAPQGPAQLLGELVVGVVHGGHPVEHLGHRRVRGGPGPQGVGDDARQVADMYPREWLRARPEGAPEAEPKGQ